MADLFLVWVILFGSFLLVLQLAAGLIGDPGPLAFAREPDERRERRPAIYAIRELLEDERIEALERNILLAEC